MHTHICFSRCQTQRDSGKTLSLSVLIQPETIFIQLLSCPAGGMQSWHLKTLASLQDRPKESVFVICTMVRRRQQKTQQLILVYRGRAFLAPKAMKSKRGNQWSDQMMDSVISWFSEMSNNREFSFLAPARNLPFYPFRYVLSSPGFNFKYGGEHAKIIIKHRRQCVWSNNVSTEQLAVNKMKIKFS